ncbi:MULTISPECIES: OmpA family protein [unclassified Coleofasciculus]|uniref:OmpA family protein n=1 Tax=unclassified Coleofasciculus TaxID=2692782 RepID=UPI00187EC1E3|nr:MULTISPECIES: OmpA family protein [unclassified Coleofasciculus]MBE9129543.1 OmpA family protein [Coleofasciculus sp. LEGE 07081]MBE9151667.1 OmpA family protein [Coleofasciculus sp. LEGE 07092]
MDSPEKPQSSVSQLEGLLDLLVNLQTIGQSSEESLPSKEKSTNGNKNADFQSEQDEPEALTKTTPVLESESNLSSQPPFKEEESPAGISSSTGDDYPSRLEKRLDQWRQSQLSEDSLTEAIASSLFEESPTHQSTPAVSEGTSNGVTNSQLQTEPSEEAISAVLENDLNLSSSSQLSENSLTEAIASSLFEESPTNPVFPSPPEATPNKRMAFQPSEPLPQESTDPAILSESGDRQPTENSITLSAKALSDMMSSQLATQPLNESTHQFLATSDDDESEDAFTPLERLQRLLIDPEILDSQQGFESLKEKFENLEHKISDSKELIKLLVPLITQILSIKITEAREEMAQAIAPIIDEMIEARAKEDKKSISRALAPLLPYALSQRILTSPGEFAKAIAPEISEAIKEQIEIERDAMVDALYPVVGSTISKYMAEAVTAINQKVETALSPEGISRKIRARMQGVSEAELIFKESMPFAIKAIFLIHKASGLVISEVQPFGKQHLESDMVAGMLTAIRSFVNDCIVQSGEVSELDRIEYGSCEITLEVAGYCYLAVVTQGYPPKSFLEKMREALSTIVQRHGNAIELFDGDPDNVPQPVHPLLKSITDFSAIVEKPKRKFPFALLALSAAVLSAIFIPLGIRHHQSGINRNLEEKTSIALASDPELAVYTLTVDAQEDTIELSGKLPSSYLVEKAGQITKTVAPNAQIKNDIIAVKVPPDPAEVAAEVERVTSLLNNMDRMAIWTSFEAGRVTVEGSVLQVADARKITEAFEKIPGVESVTNTAQLQPLALASRIYFELNSAELKSSEFQKLDQLEAFLKDYPNQTIRIIGHSDKSGNMIENQRLALERGQIVAEALVSRGIDSRRIEIAGTTKPPTGVYDDEPLNFSRFVEFEAIAP